LIDLACSIAFSRFPIAAIELELRQQDVRADQRRVRGYHALTNFSAAGDSRR
jgi:hypothetical protein